MSDFFRFPHTPHLAWLGEGQPRDDKVLCPHEAEEILARELIVEEKVDGANIGFSLDEEGHVRIQSRGRYLLREGCHPQFKPLFRWLQPREAELAEALAPDLMLFGEWCYAFHSVRYTKLPDWFLAFDVYDRARGAFWSAERRDVLAAKLGLAVVPSLGAGRFDLAQLRGLLGSSKLTEGAPEGLYVRRDQNGELAARAKLVRAEFVQAIDEHWSRRTLEVNALARR
jgi:ATP-dependent RNA circularization protein (DNA/RNA ligase family)